MHPRYRAERSSAAQTTIEQKAGEISRLLGLDDALVAGLSVVERDKELQAIFRSEAVAELLASATPAVAGLQEQLAGLQEQLAAAQERLAELEAASAKNGKKKADPPPADPAA